MPARAIPGSPEPPAGSSYWAFYDRVAEAQVGAWAPREPSRVLDLSGGRNVFAAQLAAAGHEVLHVGGRAAETPGPGRLVPVRADPRSLRWLRPASVDAVLAESRLLSRCLAAEVSVEDLLRVLRPGGRLLLVVESLLLGLAELASQGRWAELADVPAADVVLVPRPDGGVSRCFGADELTALLRQGGFEVDWVRPRSVLSISAVERALSPEGKGALGGLVRAELQLASAHEGQAAGLHLVASCRRPA